MEAKALDQNVDLTVDLSGVLLANYTDFTNETIRGNQKEFQSIIRTTTENVLIFINGTNTTTQGPLFQSRTSGFNIGVGVGLSMALCLILAAFRGIIIHRIVHSKAYRHLKRGLRSIMDAGISRRRGRGHTLPTMEDGVLSAVAGPWMFMQSVVPPTRTQSERINNVLPNGDVLFPPTHIPRSMTAPKRRKSHKRLSFVGHRPTSVTPNSPRRSSVVSIKVTPPSPSDAPGTSTASKDEYIGGGIDNIAFTHDEMDHHLNKTIPTSTVSSDTSGDEVPLDRYDTVTVSVNRSSTYNESISYF